MEWLLAGWMLALPALEACVPARWREAAPESLELLRETPVNCLLADEPAWNANLLAKAHELGFLVLASVPSRDAAAAQRALDAGADGIAAEGPRSEEMAAWARRQGKPLVEIVPRAELRYGADEKVIATYEGLWAGVRIEKDDSAHARPTGGPWIETNAGFLAFLRAAAPRAAIWMAHRAPGEPQPVSRYIQAAADAALCGARWVLDFDPDFRRRLREGDGKARKDWARLASVLRFLEERRAESQWPDAAMLALVADARTGGAVSGGIVDMIAAKHIPVRVVLPEQLPALSGEIRTLLVTAPDLLTGEQQAAARATARRGATLVNGPAGWKLAPPPPGQITYSEEQIKQLDQIWREVNAIIGRRNYGVRVFGAPGMLSALRQSPDGARLAVFLVNYTDYPVENITLHFPFRIQRPRLAEPGRVRELEMYENEEGAGADIDRVADVAIVFVERADQPKR